MVRNSSRYAVNRTITVQDEGLTTMEDREFSIVLKQIFSTSNFEIILKLCL
jgi:hypothetical protein